MGDNTQLNPGQYGDVVRDIQKSENAGAKTQVVVLDCSGSGTEELVTRGTQSLPVDDPWLQHAIDIIAADYGVNVTMQAKNKDLLKFGESIQVQTTRTTIMDLPTGTFNETYVATNAIDTISSSDDNDTEELVIEGHTVDGSGDFTFVTQTKTLTGQTKAVLDTPIARCTRMYANGSTDLVGNIYAYEDDTTTTPGVPDTGSKVHCMIPAGYNQSRKCATTLSSVDYWVVQNVGVTLISKVAAFVDCELEVRLKGKVFRSILDIGTNGPVADHEYIPYLIVPANSDIRLRASADQNGRAVSGHIQGVLLKA